MAKGGILLVAEIGILYLTIYKTEMLRYYRVNKSLTVICMHCKMVVEAEEREDAQYAN